MEGFEVFIIFYIVTVLGLFCFGMYLGNDVWHLSPLQSTLIGGGIDLTWVILLLRFA
jgi:hypothetical protein